MSFLQNSTLLSSTGHGKPLSAPNSTGSHGMESKNGRSLRSNSSIAALIQLVRNPVEIVGEAVENWYDGLTAEERAEQQRREDKKHILYLKQRNVSLESEPPF